MGKKLEKYLEAAKKPATKKGVVMKFGKKGGNDTLSFSKGKVFDADKTVKDILNFIQKNISTEEARLSNKIIKLYTEKEEEVFKKFGEEAAIDMQYALEEMLSSDERISGIIASSLGGIL